uniref:Uncharacterized protein n=1 Tax=Knipowitschia caucasica TaxID=637954 RepID=A0AAV2KWL5_KNICA
MEQLQYPNWWNHLSVFSPQQEIPILISLTVQGLNSRWAIRAAECQPVPPHVTAPTPSFTGASGTDLMELLITTSYGFPKTALPHFTSGKESDFTLLKMYSGQSAQFTR